MELTLGLSESDLVSSDHSSFGALGGDSLAAIQFARAVDDLCGVPLPVSFVLDQNNHLLAIIAKARHGYACPARYLSFHLRRGHEWTKLVPDRLPWQDAYLGSRILEQYVEEQLSRCCTDITS